MKCILNLNPGKLRIQKPAMNGSEEEIWFYPYGLFHEEPWSSKSRNSEMQKQKHKRTLLRYLPLEYDYSFASLNYE